MDADVKWQLWYEDTFDREAPRLIEAEGRGLVRGLVALWRRHLKDAVQVDGRLGFSRFNLWLPEQGHSIEAPSEDAMALTRLRMWAYGPPDCSRTDDRLLKRLAKAHARLILRGQTSERIVRAAHTSTTRDEFLARLNVG